VAVVDPDISESGLGVLNDGGMSGIRLSTMLKGAVGSDQLMPMAEKIKHLGWHIVLHVNDSREIAELEDLLRALPVPIVIDHLSRVRGGQGIDYVGFQALLKLMRETDHVWTKISSWYRLSDQGPPYDDMTPLARELIETRAERVLWGTNWPHPILWDYPMPNDTDLFDQFMDWAGDDDTRRQILVTNPETLYGFDT
jgi:predicted TIM-barrel fold metal-dependent hydrolase